MVERKTMTDKAEMDITMVRGAEVERKNLHVLETGHSSKTG